MDYLFTGQIQVRNGFGAFDSTNKNSIFLVNKNEDFNNKERQVDKSVEVR